MYSAQYPFDRGVPETNASAPSIVLEVPGGDPVTKNEARPHTNGTDLNGHPVNGVIVDSQYWPDDEGSNGSGEAPENWLDIPLVELGFNSLARLLALAKTDNNKPEAFEIENAILEKIELMRGTKSSPKRTDENDLYSMLGLVLMLADQEEIKIRPKKIKTVDLNLKFSRLFHLLASARIKNDEAGAFAIESDILERLGSWFSNEGQREQSDKLTDILILVDRIMETAKPEGQ